MKIMNQFNYTNLLQFHFDNIINNNMNRNKIYNEVIQDHSHLQYKYEGDELQNKINEIVDTLIEMETLEYNKIYS